MIKQIFFFAFLMKGLVIDCNAQGKFTSTVEIGTLISIGANKYTTETTIEGNDISSFTYPSVLRFKHPSFRLRSSINYNLSENFLGGIEAGITVRYLEPYYDNKMLLSFPVVSKFQYNFYRINDKYHLLSEAGLGYSFMTIRSGPVKEKGGLLFNGGIGLHLNAGKNIFWKVSAGFERQAEYVIFPPAQPNQPYAPVKFKRHRNQLYISMGIGFN
ncbi:MAG TPA: hypothetical protein VM012_04900 [Flavitalea sp.]|nr:hypothetical protein [Flavitalea sp.]